MTIQSDETKSKRRTIQVHDWINASFLLVIGILLGFVANGLAELFTSVFWPVAVFLMLFFALIYLFEITLDKLIDKFFSCGMVASRNPQGRKPLPVFLSLPVGFAFGVVLARLGLDDMILSFF